MNPKLILIYFTSMAVCQNWITSSDCRNKNVLTLGNIGELINGKYSTQAGAARTDCLRFHVKTAVGKKTAVAGELGHLGSRFVSHRKIQPEATLSKIHKS
jgi:hypothetical protein